MFEVSYDEKGEPCHVHEDNGFIESSRPYDKERDGWMLDQLYSSEFLGVRLGGETEFLVGEVNRLRRENFELKEQLNMWKKAAGF